MQLHMSTSSLSVDELHGKLKQYLHLKDNALQILENLSKEWPEEYQDILTKTDQLSRYISKLQNQPIPNLPQTMNRMVEFLKKAIENHLFVIGEQNNILAKTELKNKLNNAYRVFI